MQHPFLDTRIRTWIFPKKRTLTILLCAPGSVLLWINSTKEKSTERQQLKNLKPKNASHFAKLFLISDPVLQTNKEAVIKSKYLQTFLQTAVHRSPNPVGVT